MVFGYILYETTQKILYFLRHWYLDSSQGYWRFVASSVKSLDYYIAWVITLKNIFRPLYKDYSAIGIILGFIFRTLRLLFGGAIYLLIFAVSLVVYVSWILIPPYLMFLIIVG